DLNAQMKSANLLLLNHKFEEARQKAEFVLMRDPGNVRAQILIANSYAGIINLDDSIEELRWAYEVEPKALPAFIDLSVSATNFQRQAELAESHYKKALSMNGRSNPANLALGKFYLQSHRNDEADKQFQATLKIEPESKDAKLALAFFYRQT